MTSELLAAGGGLVGRVTVLFLLAWALAVALRRAPAVARRGVWAAALAASLLLPLASAVLPPIPVPFVAPAQIASPMMPVLVPGGPRAPLPMAVAAAPLRPVAEPARSPAPFVLGAWLTGCLLVLGRAVRGHLQVARLKRRAMPAERFGETVRISGAIDLPVTAGLWRPVVLLPAAAVDWPEAWRRVVLAHEAAHARRLDPAFQLVADVACALWWFHPLAWLAARGLRIERELAADDAVLLDGVTSSACAACLLDLATTPGERPPLPAQAVGALLSGAGLKARLLGILEPKRARTLGRGAALALAFFGAIPLVPLASAMPVRLAAPPVLSPAIGPGHTACVIDAATRLPLADAEVSFYPRMPYAVDAIGLGSDAAGCFRLPRARFIPGSMALYVRKGNRAARFQRLGGPTALPARIELQPAPALSGVVRSESGDPVAGARVRFDGSETRAVGPGSFTYAVTDRRGRFRLDGILEGNYRLIAEAPWSTATVLLAHVETRDVTEIVVTIPRTWPVSGYLLDEAQRPVAGARLFRPWRDQGGERHIDWDVSAADGSFRMLPRGLRLFARTRSGDTPALLASFSDGGETNLVERGEGFPARLEWIYPDRPARTITLRRGAYLSGRALLSDGSPARGAQLFADTLGAGSFERPKAVDPDGQFRLGPVEPGRVAVRGSIPIPGHYDTADTTVDLVPGERMKGVKVVLRPPGLLPSAH